MRLQILIDDLLSKLGYVHIDHVIESKVKVDEVMSAMLDYKNQPDAFDGEWIKDEWRKSRYLPGVEYKKYVERKANAFLAWRDGVNSK